MNHRDILELCYWRRESHREDSIAPSIMSPWWMKKGWGQDTGWAQCFVFPSMLWHWRLGRTSDL